jgi:hypothetical protein
VGAIYENDVLIQESVPSEMILRAKIDLVYTFFERLENDQSMCFEWVCQMR